MSACKYMQTNGCREIRSSLNTRGLCELRRVFQGAAEQKVNKAAWNAFGVHAQKNITTSGDAGCRGAEGATAPPTGEGL